jgi:tetratricopeptide (TPR) repeat protein
MDAQFDQKILFEMLRDIDQAEMSGMLELHTGKEVFQIFFQSGFVVYATERVIENSQLIEFNKRQALHLARISHGRFHFDGAAETPVVNQWHIRAADLIMEAARLISDEGRLRAEIGDPDRLMVGPVYNIDERVRGLLLVPIEFSVLSQLEEPLTIARLSDRLGLPMLEILRCIYALCSAGVLDIPHEISEIVEDNSDLPVYHAGPSPTAQPIRTLPPTAQSIGQPITQAVSPSRPVAATPVQPMAHSASANSNYQSSPAQPEPPKPAPAKPRNRLNTGALERLAGVKIRSMSGGADKEATTTPESERFYQQGMSALKSGNIANAEAYLRKAHQLVPDYLPYMTSLGRLLAKLPKKQKEAEGLLMQVCSDDMEAIEPRMALAELYESLGIKAKAEVIYKSVLTINPNHKTAQNKLAELTKGNSSWGNLFGWKK